MNATQCDHDDLLNVTEPINAASEEPFTLLLQNEHVVLESRPRTSESQSHQDDFEMHDTNEK